MDTLWIGWIVGIVQGLVVGTPFGILLAKGKPFFYRFVLKKTPVEPVIIGTGKISVPTLKIEGDKFEFEGNPYIAPPERMIPKSFLVGSVSAIYIEGIPMPLHITHNTVGFKLTDNTILSDIMRWIFGSDALKKLHGKEKITHTHLFLVGMFSLLLLAVLIQLVYGLTNMLPQIVNDFNSGMDTMRTAFSEYLKGDAVNTVDPKGPQVPNPPPGG